MDVPFQFVRTSSALMSSKGFGVHLNESDYSYDEFHNLNKTGLALNSLLNIINYGIDDAKDNHGSNPAVAYNYMLQADVALMSTVLYVSQFILPRYAMMGLYYSSNFILNFRTSMQIQIQIQCFITRYLYF